MESSLWLNRTEKAIISTLSQFGPQIYVRLFELMPKEHLCSTKTFTKYLTGLVDQGIVEKKEDGQNRIYSLLVNKKMLHLKYSKFLDKLIEDSKNPYSEIRKFFTIYKKPIKYSDLKHEEKIDIYFKILDCVGIILKWYQFLMLFTVGGFGTYEIQKKAKKLQKKYNQQLKELIGNYRKIDPALCRGIPYTVFDDLYPREERPEDPTII